MTKLRLMLIAATIASPSSTQAALYFDKDEDGAETCDDGRKETLKHALAHAQQLADDAVTYLTGLDDPRADRRNYETWFGSFDKGRRSRVSNNALAIRRALRDEDLYIDCRTDPRKRCGTMSTTGAYVINTSSVHRIYVCTAFWGYGERGQRSRGGALLHEVSHFRSVASTIDVENYSDPWSCEGLAKCDPEQAITNSYNYQFFAESYPLIPPFNCTCSLGRRGTSDTPAVLAIALLSLVIMLRAVRAARRNRPFDRRDAQ